MVIVIVVVVVIPVHLMRLCISTPKAHTNLNVTKFRRFHSEVPILITLANLLVSVLDALIVVAVKLAAAAVESNALLLM